MSLSNYLSEEQELTQSVNIFSVWRGIWKINIGKIRQYVRRQCMYAMLGNVGICTAVHSGVKDSRHRIPHGPRRPSEGIMRIRIILGTVISRLSWSTCGTVVRRERKCKCIILVAENSKKSTARYIRGIRGTARRSTQERGNATWRTAMVEHMSKDKSTGWISHQRSTT